MNTEILSINTIKLNNGLSFPLIGLGTYEPNDNDNEILINAIKYAISIGYRHFDGAWFYGNENIVGVTIKEAIRESNGELKREDFFIVSKVWNTFHSKASVRKCFEETMERLDLGYVDLYLIHWPMAFAENKGLFPFDENYKLIYSDVHYLETYQAMEELLAEGKVKSIGVSNFNISQLECILKNCKVKPVVNQFECHIYLQNKELVEFCKKNDVTVVAYSPLGAPYRSPFRNIAPDEPLLLEDKLILSLAKKYGKTAGQICLKFLVQQNIVVIPKSTTPSRIRENADIFDFNISEEDLNEIKKLERNYRVYYMEPASSSPFYPF